MKYTRIAISTLFIFLSLIIIMSALQTRNFVSISVPKATGVLQCRDENNDGRFDRYPCIWCDFEYDISNGIMSDVRCAFDTGGNPSVCSDSANKDVKYGWYHCADKNLGYCDGSNAMNGSGNRSSTDEKIGTIKCGETPSGAKTILSSKKINNGFGCGMVQVDVLVNSGDTYLVGKIDRAGSDCGEGGTTPTGQPGNTPTGQPGNTPTGQPGNTPTGQPGDTPTGQPGNTPTSQPENSPTPTSSYTPTPSNTATPTNTPTNTPTSTPTKTPTLTKTPTPTRTNTPTPTKTPTKTLTPTITRTPTPAPRCAPEICGQCGWIDGQGLCHDNGVLPNGQSCCNIITITPIVISGTIVTPTPPLYMSSTPIVISGTIITPSQTFTSSTPIVISGTVITPKQSNIYIVGSGTPTLMPLVSGYRCDPRCGICGVSDVGGVCQDTNSLPNGQICCHNSCVGNSCTKVSGIGKDSCTTSTQCFVGQGPTTAISPQTPPVSGNMPPWYLLAIPVAIIVVAIAL